MWSCVMDYKNQQKAIIALNNIMTISLQPDGKNSVAIIILCDLFGGNKCMTMAWVTNNMHLWSIYILFTWCSSGFLTFSTHLELSASERTLNHKSLGFD